MSRSRRLALAALVVVTASLWLVLRSGAPEAAPAVEAGARDIALVGGAEVREREAERNVPGRSEVADAESVKTPLPPRRAAILVLARWKSGVPAPAVELTLWNTLARSSVECVAAARTDTAGVVRFDDLVPGDYQLRSDRGDTDVLKLAPGEQEHLIELEGGVAIQGVVVDPVGQPVGAASIWLQTAFADHRGGRVLAIADAQGRFELEQVPRGLSLGAFAKGYAPSHLLDLDLVDLSATPVQLELRLQPGGALLQGVVRDVRGQPIEGAEIAFGAIPRRIEVRGRERVEAQTCRTAHSDARGAFAIVGLPHGEHPLSVRARGYGILRRDVTLQEGGAQRLELVLLDAATLHGVITDSAGKAVAGARINVYDREPDLMFIASGQLTDHEPFAHAAAITDAEGRYRLAAVTPGDAFAFVHFGDRWQSGVSALFTRAVLLLQPGGDHEWSPRLSEGLSISGVVLHRDGVAMGGVFLTLKDERSGARFVQTNDREGRFRFRCLEASTYTLVVQYWDAPAGTPPLQKEGIVPGTTPIELRAPFDAPQELERGVVHGRIDDVAQRIENLAAARIVLHSDRNWFRDTGISSDGRFRFEDVEPGRFVLTLLEGDNAIAETGWLELAPGGELDGGVLRTEAACSVRLTIVRTAATQACRPVLYFRREGAVRGTRVEVGDARELDVSKLSPGRYRVTGRGEGMLPLAAEVELRTGQSAPLRLALQQGVRSNFEFWFPAGTSARSYRYRVLGPGGETQLANERAVGMRQTRPLVLTLTLPPGPWRVEFDTDSGLSGGADFELRTDRENAPVRVDLK